MSIRVLITLLSVGFVFSACTASSDGECVFEDRIGSSMISSVELGLSIDELSDEYDLVSSALPYSDILGHKLEVCSPEATLLVETDQAGSVISISTTSPLFRTTSGGKVGMNLAQLQAAHPEGVVSTGVEEGGWIAFQLNEISGYFEFDVNDVGRDCLQDHQTCSSDFYERPAIRYWTIN